MLLFCGPGSRPRLQVSKHRSVSDGMRASKGEGRRTEGWTDRGDREGGWTRGGVNVGNRATSLLWHFPRLSLSYFFPPILCLLYSRCLLYLWLFHIKFFRCRLNFWLFVEGDAVELGKLQLVGPQPCLQHLQAHGGAHGDCTRLLAHHHWCSNLVRSLLGVKGRLGGVGFSPVLCPISHLLFPLCLSPPQPGKQPGTEAS